MYAIADTKAEVKSVKDQVVFVQREIGSMKNEIKSVKTKLDTLEHGQDILNTDVAALSLANEINDERLSDIETQLNIIESERLKSSMRIFGVDETESSCDRKCV